MDGLYQFSQAQGTLPSLHETSFQIHGPDLVRHRRPHGNFGMDGSVVSIGASGPLGGLGVPGSMVGRYRCNVFSCGEKKSACLSPVFCWHGRVLTRARYVHCFFFVTTHVMRFIFFRGFVGRAKYLSRAWAIKLAMKWRCVPKWFKVWLRWIHMGTSTSLLCFDMASDGSEPLAASPEDRSHKSQPYMHPTTSVVAHGTFSCCFLISTIPINRLPCYLRVNLSNINLHHSSLLRPYRSKENLNVTRSSQIILARLVSI